MRLLVAGKRRRPRGRRGPQQGQTQGQAVRGQVARRKPEMRVGYRRGGTCRRGVRQRHAGQQADGQGRQVFQLQGHAHGRFQCHVRVTSLRASGTGIALLRVCQPVRRTAGGHAGRMSST